MRSFCIDAPKCFRRAVTQYGSDKAIVPVNSYGKGRHYINGWDNPWLVKRLHYQWKFLRAITKGQKPAKTWFWSDDGQEASDWKATAMRIMNSEYSGNASYEWFDFEEDENGERQMYRVNQFDRISDINDPRLENPALDYLFAHPELPACAAMREFESSLEKTN